MNLEFDSLMCSQRSITSAPSFLAAEIVYLMFSVLASGVFSALNGGCTWSQDLFINDLWLDGGDQLKQEQTIGDVLVLE